MPFNNLHDKNDCICWSLVASAQKVAGSVIGRVFWANLTCSY